MKGLLQNVIRIDFYPENNAGVDEDCKQGSDMITCKFYNDCY